jgi:hypothetical protein
VDFIKSTDGGQTWSSRIQINDDEQTELISNFHPWLIVNEEGVVICVFYDERYDPNFFNFDLMAAYSFDGGKTFTSNHRISTVSSSPANARQIPNSEPIVQPTGMEHPALAMNPMAGKIGEYIGVTAFHDKINAVWTDTRDGNQEVYTANWYLPMVEPRLAYPANGAHVKADSTAFGMLPPVLGWSTSWKEDLDLYQIEITPPVGAIDSLTSTANTFLSWAGDPPAPVSYLSGWYSWRVRTFKSDISDSSDWSAPWMFYLDAQPPTQPDLISPASASVITDLTPLLDWSNSTDDLGPVTYDLYLSTNSGFPVGPLTTVYSGLAVSEYQVISNLAEGTYYWKVVAKDNVGWGNESLVGTFTVTVSCCLGTTGNVNKSVSESPDLSDLSLLVAYLVNDPRPSLPCLAEANIDGTGGIDLTDLSRLIAGLTIFPNPPAFSDCL